MITHEEIREAQVKLHQLTHKNWYNHDFLTLDWWLLIIVMILPWIIWWKLVDKDSLIEITLYGLFIALFSGILDTIGFSLGLWSYPNKVIPINPPLFPADFTLLPVTYMLLYQYFTSWKPFIIASTIVFGVYTFAGEPFLEWLGVYTTYSWQYVYSFPIYVAMSVFFRWLVKQMQRIIDKKEQENQLLYTWLYVILQDNKRLHEMKEKEPWWESILNLFNK